MRRKSIGRMVTYILRHSPQEYDLQLDKAGYVDIEKLIFSLNKNGIGIDKAEIEEIGKNERFSFNEDHTKIRADYGHSLGLKLGDMFDEPSIPPEYLYHGTHADAVESIMAQGIKRYAQLKKSRDHIFLTESIEVAKKKGNRHGKSVVLRIDAKRMYTNGYKFYNVKNDIWLIEDTISPEYITEMTTDN